MVEPESKLGDSRSDYKPQLVTTSPKPHHSFLKPAETHLFLAPTVRLAADGPDSVYTNVLPNNTAVGVTDLKTFLLSHATDSLLSQQFEVRLQLVHLEI